MRANDAQDLALIEEAVRRAGEIARRYYGQDYRRWSKSRGEPVTEADLAIDHFLRGRLEAARPDYGWLSEETGRDPTRMGAKRLFIVDPIDGTTAFLKERPHFSISVGIAEHGRAIVGVVYNPITEEFFSAFEYGGARLNGEPIHVSDCAALEGCRVLGQKDMFAHPAWPALAAWQTVQIESRSSIAYRMALIAAGKFDAAIVLTPKHDWDMAAGDVVVREAGGIVTSRDGHPLRFGGPNAVQRSMICAGPRLHAMFMDQLRHSGAGQLETLEQIHARA
ncbi:MAG TPA: 3'(2'),5'-bisphosphate nucleotidase CysQ [Rhizomicrobium sp.]|nr:3'(2'),5'-bisphosphate nucleotidase CysQ [Rhizomicrobium sp.]